MLHDPELVAEAREWFGRAERDLRAGRLDLMTDPPLTGDAAFHAQQAAEKAMKGFLTWHNRPFGKTHNLNEVGGMCVKIDSSLEPVLRRAVWLTEYAWKYRYPGEQIEAEFSFPVIPEILNRESSFFNIEHCRSGFQQRQKPVHPEPVEGRLPYFLPLIKGEGMDGGLPFIH